VAADVMLGFASVPGEPHEGFPTEANLAGERDGDVTGKENAVTTSNSASPPRRYSMP
jgi:hypothetical protein